LAVDPCAEIAEYTDAFANRAHSISIKPPHRKLVSVADSMVERFAVPGEHPQQTTFAAYLSEDESRTTEYRDFLNTSQYVPFSPRLRKFFWSARPQKSEDVANYDSRIIESACRLGKHLTSPA
jgi:transglutaminase-like putative cysteine protease